MEKSAIQDRYYQLDQEILDSAKKWNVDLTNKKVTFQKNLSQILGKRKQEEVIFDEEKRAFLFEDDPLYARAKESGNQELLEKFHNRSLTRNEYEKASEHYGVEKKLDYYYDTPARFDKIGEYNEYGLAIVEENGKKGLINKNGKVIGEIKYNDIGKFNEYGVAIVEFEESKFGKRRNIINIRGEELCEQEYYAIWEFDEDGIAIAEWRECEVLPPFAGINVHRYTLINAKWKQISDRYSHIWEFNKDGIAEVMTRCDTSLISPAITKGAIDKNGNVVPSYKLQQQIKESPSKKKWR